MKHKLRSRVLTVLLSVILTIGLLPVTVLAANTATVTINGQILIDGKPVQCGQGTAVLDEESGTLTLNNATINQESDCPVRVSDGELKVILIGKNTITSTSKRAFYCNTVNLTIQGTAGDSLIIETNSDGLQVDNGNLTIDGCNVDITSKNWGGMMCWQGTLTIQNGADITIDSYENSLIGDGGLFITNSTVNSTVHRTDLGTCAVFSNGSLNIENSILDASSGSDCAICSQGTLSIIGSVVKAQSPLDKYTIYGAGGFSLIGTWLDNVDNEVYDDNAIVENCVVINYNTGTVIGNPVIKRDVELRSDVELTIPAQTSLTIAEGITFINNGNIILNGSFINNNAFVFCADGSHAGGTVTCTSKAICVLCGNEYGELLSHNLVKTEGKEATCTEAGNEEYWICENCGKYFSDVGGKDEIKPTDTILDAKGHNYENGKCTVCSAIDPDVKVVITDGANGTWKKGGKDGLSFTSSADYELFQKVLVDRKELDVSNYTVKEGSTIVILKASYLNTLPVGKHILSIVSDTGTAETNFTVQAAAKMTATNITIDNAQSPQTGDNSNIALWIAVILFAGATLTGNFLYNRKKKDSK